MAVVSDHDCFSYLYLQLHVATMMIIVFNYQFIVFVMV